MGKIRELVRVKGQRSQVVHSVYYSSETRYGLHFTTACGKIVYDYPTQGYKYLYFAGRDKYLKTKEEVTCKTCLKALGEHVLDMQQPIENKKERYRVQRCDGKGLVHSVSLHPSGTKGYQQFHPICGSGIDATLFETVNEDLMGNGYCKTVNPVTCKRCLQIMGHKFIKIERKNEMTKKTNENKKEVCRIQRRDGKSVVHSVNLHPRGTKGYQQFYPTCGSGLASVLYENEDNGYRETENPVTCKRCLQIMGHKPIEMTEKAKTYEREPIRKVKHYIAIQEETGDAYEDDSLFGLLGCLKDNFDDDDLCIMLEDKEAFTFYEANKIDIQVKVEVTKEVVELSKC